MTIIAQITNELRQSPINIPPHVAVEYRGRLAGEYSFLSSQLGDIEIRKARTWLSLKEASKSDKEADRKWDLSEDGINEAGLKRQIKIVEKLMSALKTIIDLANNERNNSNY